MVCMSSNALAPRVIRTGARIAGRLGSKWYAVYVETPREQPGRISPQDADALQQNIRLAESLGATVVRVKAERPADGLDRLRPARGRDARHLRSERPVPVGNGHARLHARQVPQRRSRRRRAGRSAERQRPGRLNRDPPHASAARTLRLCRRAHRARGLERLAPVADERPVAADHRRELRLGRGRAGHEGEPRAAGLRRPLRAPRPAGTGPNRSCASIGRASMRRTHAPPPTSPSPARPRSSTPLADTATTTTRGSIGFSSTLAAPPPRDEALPEQRSTSTSGNSSPLFTELRGAVRPAADPQSGCDAKEGGRGGRRSPAAGF